MDRAIQPFRSQITVASWGSFGAFQPDKKWTKLENFDKKSQVRVRSKVIRELYRVFKLSGPESLS